jgi:TolB-like protein
VRSKLKFGYEYQGEHSVKNIAEPVRVYRVLTDPEDAGKIIGEEKPKPWRLAVVSVAVVLVLFLGGLTIWNFFLRPSLPSKDAVSEKMSIAVLPFDNMSKDPEQEYFADGISEDLITDLSKIPNFLVISRLSSFAYKGKSVKIQQIGKELGARYVLEGSVRKANHNVRINAQLIDATTGHHLWADRYDSNIRDIFDLQDKITQNIAASLAVKLTEEEQDRLTQKETNNIEAYEAFLKGSNIANSLRNDVEKFVESLPWFEKAVELDPDYSLAYAALAETYIFGSAFGIQRELGISYRLALMRGINYLQMAMKNPTNIAYRIAARVYTYQRQHEKALDYGMKAIALGPNEYRSNAFMALYLIYAGRPDEAVAFSERMRRADPACMW